METERGEYANFMATSTLQEKTIFCSFGVVHTDERHTLLVRYDIMVFDVERRSSICCSGDKSGFTIVGDDVVHVVEGCTLL